MAQIRHLPTELNKRNIFSLWTDPNTIATRYEDLMAKLEGRMVGAWVTESGLRSTVNRKKEV
jgi:hypothetical protein